MKAEIATEYTGNDIHCFSAQVEIVGPWIMLLLSENSSSRGSLDLVGDGKLLLIHWPSGEIVTVSLWRLVSATVLR